MHSSLIPAPGPTTAYYRLDAPIPYAGYDRFADSYRSGPVRVVVAAGKPVEVPEGNGNPIYQQPRRGRPSAYATAEDRYAAKLARQRARYAERKGEA